MKMLVQYLLEGPKSDGKFFNYKIPARPEKLKALRRIKLGCNGNVVLSLICMSAYNSATNNLERKGRSFLKRQTKRDLFQKYIYIPFKTMSICQKIKFALFSH